MPEKETRQRPITLFVRIKERLNASLNPPPKPVEPKPNLKAIQEEREELENLLEAATSDLVRWRP